MTISRGSGERKPVSIGEPDKVQSWPFKEPEKTTAWKEEELKPANDVQPVSRWLVDTEKEKAEKRTAMIKERMSPPGALNLPPLLEQNRLKYGIPDGFFKSQALFDRIFVFPIDQFDGIDTLTDGSPIQRPNLTKLKDLQEGNRGVLISAGLTAADRLMSHGVELGSVITTNKNVPFARRCERLADGTEMFFLVMREADLAGSETLAQQIREGEKQIQDVGDPGEYQHQVCDLIKEEDGLAAYGARKKKSVYINDTW